LTKLKVFEFGGVVLLGLYFFIDAHIFLTQKNAVCYDTGKLFIVESAPVSRKTMNVNENSR
jgi:hypothetical protein